MPSVLALVLAASLSAAPAAESAEPRTPTAPSAQAAAPGLPSAPSLPALPRSPAPEKREPGAAPIAPEGEFNARAEKAPGTVHAGEPLPSRTPADRPTAEAALSAAARATTAATPPSLTSRALLDELRRTAKDRQAEQGSLAEQRQKLEALSQEIEKSRAAMREETARLQGAVAAGAKGGKPGTSPLDTLAKTTKGMKAEQAAAVLTRLDRGLAAAILGRMRPGDSALVLEKMEPATAASLVALLAGRDRT